MLNQDNDAGTWDTRDDSSPMPVGFLTSSHNFTSHPITKKQSLIFEDSILYYPMNQALIWLGQKAGQLIAV